MSDDKTVSLTTLDGRLDEILAALRGTLDERREMTAMLKEMNRSIERGLDLPPKIPPDKQAMIDLRRDYASMWEMYANLQKRMDRIDQRLDEIERKVEPPLPPFPEFKP